MTVVNLLYRRMDGVTVDGVLVTAGSVEVIPAYRRDTGTGQMTTIGKTFPVGSSPVIAPGTYLFRLSASDGVGGRLKDEGVYRLVPASGTFDVDDLTEVTPTAGGMTQSDVQAMIDAAVAGIVVGPGGTPTGTGTAGAFWAQDVLNTTTAGRALMTIAGANEAAQIVAARTYLAAVAASGGTLTNVTLSGSVTVQDAALAIADTSGLQAALDAKADDSEITTLTTAVAGKAATSHTHTVGDIPSLSADVVALLGAADFAAIVTLLGAITVTGPITPDQLPPGTVMGANGPSAPRPTDRTDVFVLWTSSSDPANEVTGDIWFNGPDS